MNQKKLRRLILAIAIGATGVFVGTNISTSNVAHGEMRDGPEPPSFKRGDQIALPILRDISATLRQIDGRLSRMEIVAQKMQIALARNSVTNAAQVDTPEAK